MANALFANGPLVGKVKEFGVLPWQIDATAYEAPGELIAPPVVRYRAIAWTEDRRLGIYWTFNRRHP